MPGRRRWKPASVTPGGPATRHQATHTAATVSKAATPIQAPRRLVMAGSLRPQHTAAGGRGLCDAFAERNAFDRAETHLVLPGRRPERAPEGAEEQQHAQERPGYPRR